MWIQPNDNSIDCGETSLIRDGCDVYACFCVSAPPGGPGAPGAPQPIGWMQAPQAPPNCPPGLEYLASVDQLLVKQKVEGLEGRLGDTGGMSNIS